MKLNYKNFQVTVKKSTYFNNNLRVDLIDVEDGLTVATVSVNVKHVPLEKDQIIVKDYSENEGMADWLLENKVAEKTDTHVFVGSSKCPIFKIIV